MDTENENKQQHNPPGWKIKKNKKITYSHITNSQVSSPLVHEIFFKKRMSAFLKYKGINEKIY